MPPTPKKKTTAKTMSPKKPKPSPSSSYTPPAGPSSTFPDAALSLPAFLKYLTSSPKPPVLTMKQAMSAAGVLLPKGFNSPFKLAKLTATDLSEMGIADETIRKAITALTQNKGKGPGKYKRPPRESDLDRPLPTAAGQKNHGGEDYDFDEIDYEETLRAKSVVTNRAPILTAWATVVAERLGFKRAEALSIAHVFVGLNASAAKGAKQPELGENQPFVELMGRKIPMLSTASGEWRALDPHKYSDKASDSDELVSDPHTAFAYVRKNLAQQLGATIGAMRLLAESFAPQELNRKAFGLYYDFRPEVDGWGAKGEMKLEAILDLRRHLTHQGEEKLKEEGDGEVGDAIKVEGEDDHGNKQAKLDGWVDVKTEGGEEAKPELDKGESEDEFDKLLEDDDLDVSGLP